MTVLLIEWGAYFGFRAGVGSFFVGVWGRCCRWVLVLEFGVVLEVELVLKLRSALGVYESGLVLDLGAVV